MVSIEVRNQIAENVFEKHFADFVDLTKDFDNAKGEKFHRCYAYGRDARNDECEKMINVCKQFDMAYSYLENHPHKINKVVSSNQMMPSSYDIDTFKFRFNDGKDFGFVTDEYIVEVMVTKDFYNEILYYDFSIPNIPLPFVNDFLFEDLVMDIDKKYLPSYFIENCGDCIAYSFRGSFDETFQNEAKENARKECKNLLKYLRRFARLVKVTSEGYEKLGSKEIITFFFPFADDHNGKVFIVRDNKSDDINIRFERM